MVLQKISQDQMNNPASIFRFSDDLSIEFASFNKRYGEPLNKPGRDAFYAVSSFSALGAGVTVFIHQPIIASLFAVPAAGSYVFSKARSKRYQKKYATNFKYHETLNKMVDELGIWMYKTYGLGAAKGTRFSHVNKEFKSFVEKIIDGDEKRPGTNIVYNGHTLNFYDVETGEGGPIAYWLRVQTTEKGFSINAWKRQRSDFDRIEPAENRESLQKKRLAALAVSPATTKTFNISLSSDVASSIRKKIETVQKEYEEIRSEKYTLTPEEEYTLTRAAEDLDNVISSANLLARYKSQEDTNMVNDILAKLSSELREISNTKQEEIRKKLKIQASYIKSR